MSARKHDSQKTFANNAALPSDQEEQVTKLTKNTPSKDSSTDKNLINNSFKLEAQRKLEQTAKLEAQRKLKQTETLKSLRAKELSSQKEQMLQEALGKLKVISSSKEPSGNQTFSNLRSPNSPKSTQSNIISSEIFNALFQKLGEP